MEKQKIPDGDLKNLENLVSKIKTHLSEKSGNPQLRNVIEKKLQMVENFLKKESSLKVVSNVNVLLEILTKIINIIKIIS